MKREATNMRQETIYKCIHCGGIANISTFIHTETFEENAQGDGQFDAFMNAIRSVFRKKNFMIKRRVKRIIHRQLIYTLERSGCSFC